MAHYRVLNINHNYFVRGGSDSYFFSLEALLTDHGHEVVPFTAADTRNRPTSWAHYFPAAVNEAHPGVRDVGRFIFSRSARRDLRRLLDEQSIDIAHLHNYYGKLTSSILAPLHKAGIPIVQTLHDYKVVCPTYSCLRHGEACERCAGQEFWRCTAYRCNRGSLTRSLASMIEAYVSQKLGGVSNIDHFIAPSRFLRDLIVRNGVPTEKISVIHNFVDAELFTPATGLGEYFLYFGRLESIKGLESLIRAVAGLHQVPLLVAGDGNLRQYLESLIVELSADNVRFLGYRSGTELHDLVRGSIATLMPSTCYENCPMSVLESMALARPVVGSCIGGIPELVIDGQDGVLIAPDNVEGWREVLVRLWEDKEGARAMGQAARQRVLNEFSAADHYEQVLSVYRNLRRTNGD